MFPRAMLLALAAIAAIPPAHLYIALIAPQVVGTVCDAPQLHPRPRAPISPQSARCGCLPGRHGE